jgi:hypothetical protein
LSVAWKWYSANAATINPIGTFIGAVGAFATAAALAWAAVQNARIAARRHYEQTNADRQRRITESFSKAAEQLASDKIEARLGGIYTLERISRESRDDYWTVMETLTAFVRERTRWKERDAIAPETLARLYEDDRSLAKQRSELPTDIAAVLTVIARRDNENRALEKIKNWVLNLRESNLREASLVSVHLERANLSGVHLERADLEEARLERADLSGAHLKGATLKGAHLEGPSSMGRISKEPVLRERISKEPTFREYVSKNSTFLQHIS